MFHLRILLLLLVIVPSILCQSEDEGDAEGTTEGDGEEGGSTEDSGSDGKSAVDMAREVRDMAVSSNIPLDLLLGGSA